MERFLKKAKYLLGESVFDEILSEEKNKILEGKAATTSSAARLVDSLKRAIHCKDEVAEMPKMQERFQPELFQRIGGGEDFTLTS